MTIRIVSLTGALLAALAAPGGAQEAVSPHSLDFDRSIETDSITIQDLSGGVGSQDSSGGGSVIQIMQVQPNAGIGVSTSASAPRYSGTAATGHAR